MKTISVLHSVGEFWMLIGLGGREVIVICLSIVDTGMLNVRALITFIKTSLTMNINLMEEEPH